MRLLPRPSLQCAQAFDDLAAALGFKDAQNYNEACQNDPDEVRRRLAAL